MTETWLRPSRLRPRPGKGWTVGYFVKLGIVCTFLAAGFLLVSEHRAPSALTCTLTLQIFVGLQTLNAPTAEHISMHSLWDKAASVTGSTPQVPSGAFHPTHSDSIEVPPCA